MTTRTSPVHGSVRLVRPASVFDPAVIEITAHTQVGPVTKEYDARPLRVGREVVGYLVGGYAVRVGRVMSCDCPDYRYGRKCTASGCKHICGVRALSEHGKL